MTKIPPIGLSGFAKSGKTAAALYLESEYGYKRLHIADPLRDMLRALLREYGYSSWEINAYLEGGELTHEERTKIAKALLTSMGAKTDG